MQEHYEPISLYNLHWNLVYFNSFDLQVWLNTYQYTMLMEKNYFLLVIEMSDSFQMKYESILRQVTLKIYVH